MKHFPSSIGLLLHVLHSPEVSQAEVPLVDLLVMLLISFQTLMQLQTEDDGSHLEKPMDIPKELWMMVDYLYRNAIQQVGGGEAVTPDGGQPALRKSISPENFGPKKLFPCRTCGKLFFTGTG